MPILFLKTKKFFTCARKDFFRSVQPSILSGFTIVEMLVALSIFSVVVTSGVATLVAVSDANRRSHTLRAAVDNVSFAMENIARSMRVGIDYSTVTPPGVFDTAVSFINQAGQEITYRQNGTVIERRVGSAGSFLPITSENVVINSFQVMVAGSGANDGQPHAIIIVDGEASFKDQVKKFRLQTTVTQRALDSS